MDLFPEGERDARVREFIAPTRIVWTSENGIENAENVLQDDDSVCVLTPSPTGLPGFLLDFGCELHGGVRLDVPNTSTRQAARVRIRFGESATEAMSEPNNDHAIHDFEVRVPWMGHIEIGNTGFRFVRIDLTDRETAINLRAVRAVHIYRPLEYLGSFECSDPLLNEIWRVGARTVHLCMQDLVWDGIKRDRLAWIGDLHPEATVIASLFGDVDVVRATLDYVRDHTPLPGWMNGIPSYSLWWIIIQRDWFLRHANLAYLTEQRDYLLGLLHQIEACIDEQGQEHLPDWRFLDWPTSSDPLAIDLGLQALTALALQAGAEVCWVLGEASEADRAAATADRVRRFLRPASSSKQANALAVLAGAADAEKTNRNILARDPFRGVSTFYGFYVLQARAKAGDYRGCLELIRKYWGGMLSVGATTFWEHFELDWLDNAGRIDEIVPPDKHDIHAEYGDYCFKGLRHSLCHGWAGGPTAWLMEHVLGLAPAAPGFAKLRVCPHLADLDFARGTIPTPHGVVRVSHERKASGEIETAIDCPDEIEVV